MNLIFSLYLRENDGNCIKTDFYSPLKKIDHEKAITSIANHADGIARRTCQCDHQQHQLSCANFRSYLLSEYPSGTITTAQLNARDSLKLFGKGFLT